jgi:hypothetical protein
MQKIIYTCWAILLCSCVAAQINIKVGYNAQYTPLKATNRLFDTYNSSTANISTKYKPFHFMHGLDLGLRYMISNTLGLEAGFTNLFSADNQSSKNSNGVISNDEWRLSNRYISVGFENYFKWFGYGVHLGQSKWKYLKDFPGANSKQAVYNSDFYAVKFNLIFQAQSGRNAFAFKPYYYYPLTNKNIATVGEALNGASNLTVENFQGFGLSVIFYNGPQR